MSEEFKNNEKLKCVYDKLAGDNSSLFKDTIGAFIGNRNVNLILEIGECSITDDACTQSQYVEETGTITIIIEDINADSIEIAQMILHEAIHAELSKYVLEHHDEVDTDDHPRLFELYKFYRALDVPEHHLDHPYMALNYITPLAFALRSYDNNSYPLDHYKGFAWEGLEKWDVNSVLDTPLINEYNEFKTIVKENSDVCN